LKECKWKPPQGAFYFFPNIQTFLGRKTPQGSVIHSDEDLAVYIVEKYQVVTLPGSKFWKPGYLRLAFANMNEMTIKKGCQLLSDALHSLT